MQDERITFGRDSFNKLFPFFILIDTQFQIVSTGKTLEKIINVPTPALFFDYFDIKRPDHARPNTQDLRALIDQLVIIETKQKCPIALRGQFEFLPTEQCYLFVGAPWFSSMDQVRDNKLTLHDFALHDPMIDLLHVLKTQEITTQEIKQLLTTVNQQKNKLKQSEINYRTIVERATEIIYKINADGKFTFVNDVAQRITGYSKSELLKMSFLDLVRDDFKEILMAFYSQQIKNKITSTYYEFPILTKVKKDVWIGQSLQYPQTENQSIELTALAIDISVRKNAELKLSLQEEKYRNIIANMNLGLLEVDNNDSILFANQSFRKLSGFTLHELLGQKAANLFMVKSKQSIINNKNDIRKKGVSDMYSVQVKNKKGQKRWWMISGAPQFNDKEEIVGSVGIHLDITEQKELEEELKKAKNKAEDSSKAKELFLATMSHEIRTPLNAIIGITDLMKSDAKTRSKENIDILSFSSKNLMSLISDILDFAKIESGKITLLKNSINIGILLNGIYQTFKPACEEKNVSLVLNIDPSVPQIIIGDELRLSQVLYNLISNAVKFTPQGLIEILVFAEPITHDTIRLFFKVSDSGIGIDKNKIKTIFNAFEQADSNILRQFGGTGLGLSITKKLIELQKGNITAESVSKKGSTFSFNIDYTFDLSKQKSTIKLVNQSTPAKLISTDKLILLVEDNIINQQVVIAYFKQWGLKWEIANNGAEALEMLALKKYDLALVDIFMPIMDGFTTIKHIKKNPALANLPIIALTASAETSLMDNAIALGANYCLTKPFKADLLIDSITNLLSSENNINHTNLLAVKYKNRITSLINLTQIETASFGSSQFVTNMISMLIKETNISLDQASLLLEIGDLDRFAKVIHKMKSNFLILGVESERQSLNFMEQNTNAFENLNEIKTKFTQLKITWSKVLLELRAIKSK